MLKRKVLIASMIMAIIFAIIPMGISNAADAVNFKVSSAQGANGEEVTISVDMQNAAEFAATNLSLSYDKEKLEYVSSEEGTILSSGMMHLLNHNANNGTVSAAYTANPQDTNQTKQAGNFFNVKFKIKENASGVANLTLNCSTIKQKDGTVLTANITQGKVTITKALTGIALNKTSLNLNKGANETLTVNYTPADTTDSKEVTWTSSNTSVATVENGKVTAVAPGKATITAKVGSKTATCNVTVVAPLESISLNKTKTSLVKGQAETLKVTYAPADTTDSKDVTWTSSNTAVATVKNGKVTAVKAGTATITAKVGSKTATCDVTVTEIPLKSIAINKADLELVKGTDETCSVIYNPNDTTDDKTVTWSSSDEKVATVDKNGKITAVAEGKATITAKVGDKTASVTVNVILLPMTSAKIDEVEEEAKTIAKDGSLQLKIVVNPTNTTDEVKTVWTSSDEKVLTVDENGKVTGVNAGEATVKAVVNGKFESEIKLTVSEEKAAETSTSEDSKKDTTNAEGKTEEKTSKEKKSSKPSILPKTGDFAIVVYSALALISVAGIVFIIRKRNK